MTGADIITNYRLGSDLSRENQERSLFVIESPILATWVKSERSAVLVVNGYSKRIEPKSALSFVGARLVYTLDQIRTGAEFAAASTARPDIITLHFFCGQHISGEETWESPAGVVNSLLAQLLKQCKGIDITRLAKIPRDFDNTDIEETFSLFDATFKLLPPDSTVFCVVDALSFFVDSDDMCQDAKFLAASLIGLANKRSPKRPIFKLLLTAPNRLRVAEVDELKTDKEVINVPPSLPNTGGFTALNEMESWSGKAT